MGTRNLIAVKTGGKYKIAQYCQWDGYPEGQGKEVLEFLSSKDRRKKLKSQASKCHFLTPKALEAMQAESEKDEIGFWEKHIHISRDAGSNILNMVADSKDGLALKNSLDFASDSLFCEWAWVVDFDAGTFEAFKGFNKNPVPKGQRFSSLPREKGNEYYPVTYVKKWKLSDLPTVKEFLATFATDED